MEKTTKKRRKKTKSLKRRIGIIAVGGLSLVLTVCLSVGATLAWFAGSTWASKSLYMGGPVYVEMTGREGDLNATTDWVGGQGNLDIQAVASTRTTGTVDNFGSGSGGGITNVSKDDILLPGQKVEIFSKARVFTTAATDTIADSGQVDLSSGANTDNTSNDYTEGGVTKYYTESGRVTTSTSSVLRARFSINIEFDPSVGFNNFTDKSYMQSYPVQSGTYIGDSIAYGAEVATQPSSLTWKAALDATQYKVGANGKPTAPTASSGNAAVARRDAVAAGTKYTDVAVIGALANQGKNTEGSADEQTAMKAIQAGTKKSIFKWRYCSETEWKTAGTSSKTAPMGYPFNGGDKSKNSNGYYGVWITDGAGIAAANLTESDAFYKDRCNAYLQSYVEYYVNEYGNTVTRTLSSSIEALDAQLNQYFVQLVNDSSDDIIQAQKDAGETTDFASWLYIDPTQGNDTNSNEISTSTGGWWYLVSCDDGKVGGKVAADRTNEINTEVDSASTDGYETGKTSTNADYNYNQTNTPTADATATFNRTDTGYGSTDAGRLKAKLFEIKTFYDTGEDVGKHTNGTEINKVVSMEFPFVNGTFALPTDALTNVFANAKISFQISFQAMQAFFPYTETIDKIKYDDKLLGTRKALNIQNAIPIYNEAFDYEENNYAEVDGL